MKIAKIHETNIEQMKLISSNDVHYAGSRRERKPAMSKLIHKKELIFATRGHLQSLIRGHFRTFQPKNVFFWADIINLSSIIRHIFMIHTGCNILYRLLCSKY